MQQTTQFPRSLLTVVQQMPQYTSGLVSETNLDATPVTLTVPSHDRWYKHWTNCSLGLVKSKSEPFVEGVLKYVTLCHGYFLYPLLRWLTKAYLGKKLITYKKRDTYCLLSW